MKRIVFVLLCLLLVGCVTAVDESLPYTELPTITVATEVKLVASPSHPTAYLPFTPISAGEKVQVIGSDENAAWLFVLNKEQLGWMPSIFSRDNVATIKTAIVFQPQMDNCTEYLDAVVAPKESWKNSNANAVIVVGSIYRPQTSQQFDDASLAIQINGSGMVVDSDYIHTSLTPPTAVVLFAFSVDGLQKGSEISFALAKAGEEPFSFQAAFFSDDCANNANTTQLAIGKTKGVSAEQDTTAKPSDTAPDSQAAPSPLIIFPSRNAASFYDEFDSAVLNPRWTWVKEDPSRWSLEKTPGKLRITATGGDMAFECRNHQNLLLQDTLSENFEIQTKVTIRPTQNYQQGGLIVLDDLDNYLKFDLLWSDFFMDDGYETGEGIELLSEQNGEFMPAWPAWPHSHIKLDNEGVYLKLRKEGTWYDGYYSKDGQQWIRFGSISVPKIVSPQVGIFALGGNHADNCTPAVPDTPVDFDFFQLNSIEASEPVAQLGSTGHLLTHFEEFGYEYVWFTDNTEKVVKILDIHVDGNHVTMQYDANNGSLIGMLNDNVYTGKWVSDAGSGDFAFTFATDFSTAIGWWSEGDDSPKQIQFLR